MRRMRRMGRLRRDSNLFFRRLRGWGKGAARGSGGSRRRLRSFAALRLRGQGAPRTFAWQPAKRAIRPVAQSDQRELWESGWPQTQSPRRGRLLLAGFGAAHRREGAAPFGGSAGRGVGSQGSLRSPWATSCLTPVRGLRMGGGRACSAQTSPPPTQGRWGGPGGWNPWDQWGVWGEGGAITRQENAHPFSSSRITDCALRLPPLFPGPDSACPNRANICIIARGTKTLRLSGTGGNGER